MGVVYKCIKNSVCKPIEVEESSELIRNYGWITEPLSWLKLKTMVKML